jgi:hypothetical protein
MDIFSGSTESVDSTMTQMATKHALLHPSVTKDTSFRWTSVHFEVYLGNGCKVGKDQRENTKGYIVVLQTQHGAWIQVYSNLAANIWQSMIAETLHGSKTGFVFSREKFEIMVTFKGYLQIIRYRLQLLPTELFAKTRRLNSRVSGEKT